MPMTRGRVSFARVAIGGDAPRAINGDTLALLEAGVIGVGGTAVSQEIEAGWTAGDHVFDHSFAHEKNTFSAGGCGLLGLRIDTNRVPAEIKRALRAQHETAIAETHGGTRTRSGKREARELTEHAVLDELASGKHRKSAAVDLMWDAARGVVLSAAAGQGVIDALRAHWKATLDGSLMPESAGGVAWRLASARGDTRWLEDVRPGVFTPVPDGAASDRPDAPWCHAGGATDDWIGNEMLLWLWYSAEAGDGIAVTLDGGERVEAEIVFDGPIELECPWGVMGKVAIKAHEEGVAASRTAEAREAIRIGKQPRRAGLMISDGEQAWRLTLQADRWLISGCELPKDEADDELDPRELIEVRVERIRRLDALLMGLLDAFIQIRSGDGWSVVQPRIAEWARTGERPSRTMPPNAEIAVSPLESGSSVSETAAVSS